MKNFKKNDKVIFTTSCGRSYDGKILEVNEKNKERIYNVSIILNDKEVMIWNVSNKNLKKIDE